MPLSVIDPLTPAFERTKQILFQPFDFGKWLRLGFCAFLMGLASGGGGGSGGGGSPPNGLGMDGPAFESMMEWFRDNLAVILIIAGAIFLVAVLIGLLLTWLSSRGRFMFLDGVVRDRGAVVEPWNEFQPEGNSLFLFRVCLGLATFLVALLILGLCVLLAMPDIRQEQFGGFALGAILSAIALFLVFGITVGVISVFLTDFVVPIMYLRRMTAMDAWREFYSSMLRGNAGPFALYFLMKIVLGMVVGFFAVALTCLTCCIAAIPYVGSVILLPLSVFMQAYPLYFIEQFGPTWNVFSPAKPPPLKDTAPYPGEGF